MRGIFWNEATTFFITDQKMQIRPFKITLVGQKDSGKSDIRRLLDANGIIQDSKLSGYL